MKRLSLFVLLLFFSISLHSIDLSTGSDSGSVVLYRLGGVNFATASEIMINQSVLVTLKVNEALEIELDPGVYLIHVQPAKFLDYLSPMFDVIKVEVKAGETTYFDIVPEFGKAFVFKRLDEPKKRDKYRWIEDLIWIRGEE